MAKLCKVNFVANTFIPLLEWKIFLFALHYIRHYINLGISARYANFILHITKYDFYDWMSTISYDFVLKIEVMYQNKNENILTT